MDTPAGRPVHYRDGVGLAHELAYDSRVTAIHGTHAIRIRAATPADADALSELAARTFWDTFAADNSPDDIAAYMSATFTPQLQAAELVGPGAVVLVATVDGSGDDLIAYAHIGAGPAPEPVSGPEPAIELRRFYVTAEWHGLGVAQQLMQRVWSAAGELGGRTLWLGVWERNARAIAFYRKVGFRHVGSQPFQLGRDMQTDWVMVRMLNSPPSTD